VTYALIDGKLTHGAIRHGMHIGKLAGVPTGEPRRKIELDERDPATGFYFKYITPMRPPTELELAQWERDTFRYADERLNGEIIIVFLDDIQVLDTEDVLCAECKALTDGEVNDFLCVDCRYAPSS
jgi:hypothetical protein